MATAWATCAARGTRARSGRRFPSWLARFLCLMVLPLVMLTVQATQSAASAETIAVGDLATGQKRQSSGLWGAWESCSITGRLRLHDTGLHSVRATLRCSWGATWGDVDTVDVIAYGAGENCSLDGTFAITEDTDQEVTLTGTLDAATPLRADCDVTTGSIQTYDLYEAGWSDPTTSDQAHNPMVFPWPLGFLPVADPYAAGSCATQLPTIAEPVIGAAGHSSSGGSIWATRPVVFSMVTAPGAGITVWTYVVTKRLSGGAPSLAKPLYFPDPSATAFEKAGVIYDVQVAASSLSSGAMTTYATEPGYSATMGARLSATATSGLPAATSQIVGAGYIVTSGSTPSSMNVGGSVSNTGRYGVGVTIPGGPCQAYWGESLVTDAMPSGSPAGSTGTPVAPLHDPETGGAGPVDESTPIDNPVPEDHASEGCDGFSFTDPTSWAGAGICVLVKAMYAAVDALKKLAGAIGGVVSAILAGLGGLFIPSEGFLDGAVDDLSASVDATNVGDWKDTVTSVWDDAAATTPVPGSARAALSTGSGCEGPAFTWDKFETANLPATIHPFKACTGMAETASDWVRLILQFIVGFGGLMKIAQMVMASFGFVRQTDILLGHDWQSGRFS